MPLDSEPDDGHGAQSNCARDDSTAPLTPLSTGVAKRPTDTTPSSDTPPHCAGVLRESIPSFTQNDRQLSNVPDMELATDSHHTTRMLATFARDPDIYAHMPLAECYVGSTPTNEEAGSSVSSASASIELASRSVGRWQHDMDVRTCGKCERRFTFFFRRHHCRRCGQIYCDACSQSRVHLLASDLVIDPAVPEMFRSEQSGSSRVCDICVDAYNLVVHTTQPRAEQCSDASVFANMFRLVRGSQPRQRAVFDTGSASALGECPCARRTLWYVSL
ncbi:hypothetical protein MVES_001116 [Malassezia vespertilionis]|uniref:FYVE-type domain-containing protein n=1 Tax=Malassezia vespertilionis TaxID=2020962 RepID=A0A2N1JF86_9BASI|nr:hypothetical protein MVES_001116 [Malassezia vespertilionis]